MFVFEDNKLYGLAPLFGGSPFNPKTVCTVHNALQMAFTIKTKEEVLNNYLPEGYELMKPEVTIGFAQFRDCDFFGGAGYNAVEVMIPVRYRGKKDQLDGELMLVVWENKAIPIIGGREETGIPKIPADIQDLQRYQDKYFTSLSFEGSTFLQMEMYNPQPMDGQALEEVKAQNATINALGWRYIPRIGVAGAELSQPTLYPQFYHVNNAWVGSGQVTWTKLKYEQNAREYYIINALADIPVLSMGPVVMCHGYFELKPFMGRVLH